MPSSVSVSLNDTAGNDTVRCTSNSSRNAHGASAAASGRSELEQNGDLVRKNAAASTGFSATSRFSLTSRRHPLLEESSTRNSRVSGSNATQIECGARRRHSAVSPPDAPMSTHTGGSSATTSVRRILVINFLTGPSTSRAPPQATEQMSEQSTRTAPGAASPHELDERRSAGSRFLHRDTAHMDRSGREVHIVDPRVDTVSSRQVVPDIVDERAAWIESQLVLEERGGVPAYRPGIIGAGDLVLEHPCVLVGAIEIEFSGQRPAAQLGDQVMTIRVEQSPAPPPAGTTPTVGAAEEERFRQGLLDRIDVPVYARNTLIILVVVQRFVHEPHKESACDEIVLHHNHAVTLAQDLRHSLNDRVGKAKILVALHDRYRSKSHNCPQIAPDGGHVAELGFASRAVRKHHQIRVERTIVFGQRRQRPLRVS